MVLALQEISQLSAPQAPINLQWRPRDLSQLSLGARQLGPALFTVAQALLHLLGMNTRYNCSFTSNQNWGWG
jgi:hypothetical protein